MPPNLVGVDRGQATEALLAAACRSGRRRGSRQHRARGHRDQRRPQLGQRGADPERGGPVDEPGPVEVPELVGLTQAEDEVDACATSGWSQPHDRGDRRGGPRHVISQEPRRAPRWRAAPRWRSWSRSRPRRPRHRPPRRRRPRRTRHRPSTGPPTEDPGGRPGARWRRWRRWRRPATGPDDTAARPASERLGVDQRGPAAEGRHLQPCGLLDLQAEIHLGDVLAVVGRRREASDAADNRVRVTDGLDAVRGCVGDPCSTTVLPTHLMPLVEIRRWSCRLTAVAPPCHSALTKAWMSCWCTTSRLGSSALRVGARRERR